MSVSLTIRRPGREIESLPMCGQRTATQWVGEMARKHGFRILTGDYPAFMYQPGDLEPAIREVAILREEMLRHYDATYRSEVDKESVRKSWDAILRRLHELKDEPDAEAYFG